MKRICMVAFLICSLVSCWVSVKSFSKNITVECGSIPEDFGADESGILIVKEGIPKYDQKLIKGFEENYFGEYTFITKGALKKIDDTSSVYSDTSQYRYIFKRDKISKGRSDKNIHAVSKFYITDRMTQKKYYACISSGNFANLIKAYAINLEKQRQKARSESE